MADISDTLKDLLGDEDKLSGIMGMLSGGDDTAADAGNMLMQAQGLIRQLSSASDSRAGLLLSLKPYMKDSRKGTIDNAVKILNLMRLMRMFGGGMLNV